MTSPDAKSELQTGRAPDLDGTGLRVALVCARFNDVITNRLLSGCRDRFVEHGVKDDDIAESWVAGSFELPLAAKALAATGRYDAVVVLGAVIKGESAHFDHVATQCAAGTMRAGLDTGVPVVFGVLTTYTPEQAFARAGGGVESAETAVEMASLLRSLR
jgi:6,7-dimethyl-8-ribityllumazine synthase